MSRAYVDASCIIAVGLIERGSVDVEGDLIKFDQLVSSNLLEAEVRSVFLREGGRDPRAYLGWLDWVIPNRGLGAEISTVLDAGSVRGADCWHLATALYVSPDPSELTFLTLDKRQRTVAKALGFAT